VEHSALAARAELQEILPMNDEIRARLKCADQLDHDERLMTSHSHADENGLLLVRTS
jgi:hypothetical protein